MNELILVEADRPEDENQWWIDTYLKDDFIECDVCRSKPGSPILCYGCLCNKQLISALQFQLKELEDT